MIKILSRRTEYEARGPSLEQLTKKLLHPNESPTRLGSKSVGMWFRTGSVSQYTRHWNQDGSPGEKPERRPTRIFEQLLGETATGTAGAPMVGAPTDPARRFALGQETKNCSLPAGGVTDAGKGVPHDIAQGRAGGSAPITTYEAFPAAFKLLA